MRKCPSLLASLALATLGCAHHQQNQYAYAPPLAPPVYPQPQMPAPAVVAPAAAPSGMPMAPAGTLPAGTVPAAMPVSMNGDPCCPPLEGGAVGVPVVYETAAGQTPPCPPGP